MRGLDKVAALLLLVMTLWAFFGEERGSGPPPPPLRGQAEPAAPPPAGSGRVPLPPPSAHDPLYEVAPGAEGGTSTGTAFSVDGSGLWLTARHVVKGCARIGLRGREGWVRASVAWTHPGADVALIRTRGGTPALALSGDVPSRGMEGFGMGFPQGRPGAVQGRLLGRGQMQARGLFKGRAPTLEWAEVRRSPPFRGSLGGISGGPLLDEGGNVLGVMVAEEPRRGRFTTAAPETLAALAGSERALTLAAPGARAAAITPSGFGGVADKLRGRLSIVQVLCQSR